MPIRMTSEIPKTVSKTFSLKHAKNTTYRESFRNPGEEARKRTPEQGRDNLSVE